MFDGQRERLLEILGLLSEATKKITEILRVIGSRRPLTQEQTALVADVAERVDHVLANVLDQVPASLPEIPAQQFAQEVQADTNVAVFPPLAADPNPPRRRNRLTITEEELQNLYIEEDLPARIIAERYQVSAAAINQRLRLWGIQKRGPRSKLPRLASMEEAEIEQEVDEMLKEDGLQPDSPDVKASDEIVRPPYEPDPDAVREAEAAFRDAEMPTGRVE